MMLSDEPKSLSLLKIGSGSIWGPNEVLKHDWQQPSLTIGAVNLRL